MATKEMIGGCCVCSDETGSEDNPLVYCDGEGCSVAVHQACYGIQVVPQGPWFCKRCESTERVARVKCDLCPQRDGAVKTTDKQSWAHVICALYIPEVDFGNTATMEPIRLKSIPSDRFHKTCYICMDAGRESKAATGACMQCNKSNCKNYFHITCAQAEGLLCEEFQQSIEDTQDVHYCGYCDHHFKKIVAHGEKKYVKDKAGNKKLTYAINRKEYPIIRPIPAFRPIPCDPKSPLDASSLSGKKISSLKDHHKDSTSKSSSSSKDSHRDKDKDHSSFNGMKKSSTTTSSSNSKEKSKDLSSKSSTSSSSSSLSSSSKKDKDPLISSTFLKEKEREKEPSTPTFLAKDKLDIGSRPFESKPPEGQFSLSSFINPNLKNKLQEQKQREKEKELEKLSAEEKFDALFPKPKSDSFSKNTQSGSSSSKTSTDKRDASSDKSKSSSQPRKITTTGSSKESERSALSLTTSVLGSFGDRKSKESPSSTRRASDSSTDSDVVVKKKRVRDSSSSSSSESDSDDERTKKKKKKESPVLKKKTSSSTKTPSTVVKSSKDKVDSSKTSKSGTSSGKSPSRSSDKPLNVNGSSPTKKPLGRPKKKVPIPSPRAASKPSPKPAAFIEDDDDDDDDDEDDIDVVSKKKDSDKNKSKKVVKKSSPSTSSSFKRKARVDKDDEDEECSTEDEEYASSVHTDNQDDRKSKRVKTSAKSSPSTSSVSSAKNTSQRVLRKSSTEGPMSRTPSASPARSSLSPNKSSPEKETRDPQSSPSDSTLSKRNGFLPPSLIPITNRRASAGHSIDMAFAHPAPPTARSASKSLAVRDSTEPPASSLEALLERQWAQGSQFILDQAQHYDIASLLSCLSQLRQDNERLEDRMKHLNSRREHLLAVNARLALPLNGSFAGALSQVSGLSASQIASQHHNSFLPPPSHVSTSSSTAIIASSASVSSLHHHLMPGSSLSNASSTSSSLPSSLSGLPSFHLVPRETSDFGRRPSHDSNPPSTSTSHINMNGIGSGSGGRSSGDNRPHSGYGLTPELAIYAASVAAAAGNHGTNHSSGTAFPSLSNSLRSTPSPSTNSSSSRASPYHLGTTNPLGLNLSAHSNQVASSSSHNNRR